MEGRHRAIAIEELDSTSHTHMAWEEDEEDGEEEEL